MSKTFATVTYALTLAFFGAFFIWPIAQTLGGAFLDADGRVTFAYVAEVFRNEIYVAGLLGGFLLGLVSRRADGRDALTGMGIAVAAMASLWAAQQFGGVPKVVDTLWFALVGSAITVGVGELSARLRGPRPLA